MIMIVISYNALQKRLISQKCKKCSPGKYAMLLYVAVSIRWISIRFDFGNALWNAQLKIFFYELNMDQTKLFMVPL